ncbi:MAG: hypothetical protein ACKVUT_07445 [Gaiella sp.]
MLAVTCVVISLIGALAVASAGLGADIGANDDTGTHEPESRAVFYDRMATLGLRQVVLTVRFDPTVETGIANPELLDASVTAARARGLRVVFAVYPYPPRVIESGSVTPAGFASWLARLAGRYPSVRQYIVGNEPNQPAFWRPQFSSRGKPVSAAAFGALLAAAYDTLKAIDPAIRVVGIGLSPRGNDRPRARSNVSTSPVRFLAALGVWYRASGRTRPLMDALSLHAYPRSARDPVTRGYDWPNAGFVNLDRIRQALWDAFRGTGQPTTVTGLRIHLDELGWQVGTEGHPGYRGAENVPVTTESAQAAAYAEVLRKAACDPDIAEVNVFGFYDDDERTGFQSALHRADGTAREAAEVVRAAIADGGASCRRLLARRWRSARGVVSTPAPSAAMVEGAVDVRGPVGEGVTALACWFGADVADTDAALRLWRRAQEVPSRCARAAAVPDRPLRLRLGWSDGEEQPVAVVVRLWAETNRSRTVLFVVPVR